LEYNWEGKLRSATGGSDSISLKYDPLGNRENSQFWIQDDCTIIAFEKNTIPRYIMLSADRSKMVVIDSYYFAPGPHARMPELFKK